MKKIVILYSFVITSFMAISGILNATSLTEIASAVILFTPLAFYFTILMLPKRHNSVSAVEPIIDIIPNELKKIKNTDYDPERRKFLKLIGAAGGSLFLMTVFTKKAEAAFFGSMPGPGTISIKNTSGTQIDPAEKKPTDGYNINQIDDTSSDTYSYYGYTNKDGAWFIIRETTSGVNTGQYRYVKGASNFPTGWGLKSDPGTEYGYFDEIF